MAYDRVVTELNVARLRGTSFPIVHSLIEASLAVGGVGKEQVEIAWQLTRKIIVLANSGPGWEELVGELELKEGDLCTAEAIKLYNLAEDYATVVCSMLLTVHWSLLLVVG